MSEVMNLLDMMVDGQQDVKQTTPQSANYKTLKTFARINTTQQSHDRSNYLTNRTQMAINILAITSSVPNSKIVR